MLNFISDIAMNDDVVEFSLKNINITVFVKGEKKPTKTPNVLRLYFVSNVDSIKSPIYLKVMSLP
jgi:hypothetical protein